MALCSARAISYAGDQVATVALVLLVSQSHPATAVGALLLAESVPWLLSAFLGGIADRVERRRLMLICQLGQGVIFAVITLWLPPFLALLGLVFVASAMGTLLRSATHSTLPSIVSADELMPANALLGGALNIAVVLGPAIGGAISGLAGPRWALALDTATFVASAATLLLLPRLIPEPRSDEGDHGSARSALRFAMRDPVLRALLLSIGLLVAFAGIDNVAIVFLVRDTLGHGSAAYGIAMAVFGAGMLLGTVIVIRFAAWGAERLLFGSVVASTIATALLGLAPGMGVVLLAQVMGGAGNGVDVAAGNTIIQRRAPAGMIGRISGASQSFVAVGFLVAYIGGGALVDATSPQTAFLIAACGCLLAVAVLVPIVRSPATVAD